MADWATLSANKRHKLSSTLIFAAAIAAACLAMITPIGVSIDRALAPLRFSIFNRSASGDVVVVEMDARSASAIKRWPWSRSNYATVVDKLRAAGAATIVFDVDFSSASDQAGDAAFAASLSRAEGLIVLPTFAQSAGSADRRSIDALPLPMFRDHAALASVSVSPDGDGQVRALPFATITADMPRPSLSAYMAHRSGTADVQYPIDMSIDPASIPRISFIDVQAGNFDPAAVRGKNVLIGATAIEMGDRYATARWGVIPGVVIQAIGAETLFRGIPREDSAAVPMLLAAVAALVILAARKRIAIAATAIASVIGVAAFVVASQHVLQIIFPLAPALVTLFWITTLCAGRDVADRMRQQRIVDDATGLPNRRAMVADLATQQEFAIATARIAEYDKLAAALGSGGTAELVKRVRDRISVLCGGLTIYRIDDRVLAWEATVDADQIATRTEQLRAIMVSPIEVEGRKIDVSLVVGFAKAEAGNAADTIANASMAADLAMTSGTEWHVHDAGDATSARTEVSLLSDLDAAMVAGEVTVVYQPKLDLRTGDITSAEALVRWTHQTRGVLRPDYFIPVVEKANRIDRLTIYVLTCVIADMQYWRAHGRKMRVAVNLSAVLLESTRFIKELNALISDADIDHTDLIFEVTESATMRAPERAIAALDLFKNLGIAISVDDYGTGQSTLSYLKKLPLDELKIDRSFVEFAHQNRGDAVLVRSTIDLAHELGLKVVAEGVETEECLEFLRSVDCDMAQGYLISRPIAPDVFWELLNTPMTKAA
jgi:diguanylate cyclase